MKKSIACIAAFHVGKLFPIYTFAGSLNAETYKYYLTNVIGSHPGFSLLTDNASIHKTPDVCDAIKQQLDLKIITIPAYSPDLNPINDGHKNSI